MSLISISVLPDGLNQKFINFSKKVYVLNEKFMLSNFEESIPKFYYNKHYL